jgi:hypothetical protein
MTNGSKVLSKMLDRLMAGMMSGPNMNCRPNRSRQRIDLTQLTKLADVSPDDLLKSLLGADKCGKVVARVKMPKKRGGEDGQPSESEKAWLDQSALLSKLRVIADDARTYENDTGVHALSIGFPLLSLPPGSFGNGAKSSTKRILAPVAFIPVTLSVKGGATPSVEIACREQGIDRVVPNVALLSWIEQQTGKLAAENLFDDEEGSHCWREITALVKHVADAMKIDAPDLPGELKPEPQPAEDPTRSGRPEGAPIPASTPVGDVDTSDLGAMPVDGGPSSFSGRPEGAPVQPVATPVVEEKQPMGETPMLRSADDDSSQPTILLAAVLGLFPTAHQGLLRDTQAMIEEKTSPTGPIQSFLTSGIDFDAPAMPVSGQAVIEKKERQIAEQRLAANADPCQARAVALSRTAAGLVVHGPPGTGKSQTITNIIADHLARGQRVLLVCEKRTALDVVADRLEHMGLGKLCAIVHDPQRDQRELYKSIHEQLAELPEVKTNAKADGELAKVDAELQQLHDELSGYHKSLMDGGADGSPSFHELMGQWLTLSAESPVRVDEANIAAISAADLEKNRANLAELFDRAAKVEYSRNPWTRCAGISLADYLSRPMAQARTAMSRIVAAAEQADAAADPRIPAFNDHVPVPQQAAARAEIAEKLAEAIPLAITSGIAPLAGADIAAVRKLTQQIAANSAVVAALRSGPVDPVLTSFMPTSIPQIKQDLLAIDQYLAVARKWWAFFAFGAKSAAAAVLKKFALPLSVGDAERLKAFLSAVEARLVLSALMGEPVIAADDRIERYLVAVEKWLPLLEKIARDPALDGIGKVLAKIKFNLARTPALRYSEESGEAQDNPALRSTSEPASEMTGKPASGATGPNDFRNEKGDGNKKEDGEVFIAQTPVLRYAEEPDRSAENPAPVSTSDPDRAGEDPALRSTSEPESEEIVDKTAGLTGPDDFLEGLRLSVARAEAIVRVEEELHSSSLFADDWLATFSASLRSGKLARETAGSLSDRLDQLEGVLRVRVGRAALPAMLGPVADQILSQVASVDGALASVSQKVLSNEITRRLRDNPALQAIDGHRIEAGFDRFRELELKKKQLVREAILHHWTSRQQERLLAGTGSRLNTLGADLRRRMTSRGENAKRLRQVVAMGANIEGGDPLFDLCPVWMASPETVAQIFPRSTLFDVVVFDEASQCRLEEALPVLTRGKRVVIAGDPNQLPPTRFFESGLVQSEDEDPQNEQELFESQQGEIEDLLGAALNLSIQQCYLDVHYRSRNADLIEFSNRNFYGSRLQAIPGHPANRSKFSPLTLYRVDGVYSKRRNEAEADRVVAIVHDLLKRAEPPSIGIACLNLPQRDLIVEKLDELAAEDGDFAKRLAAARQRKGQGSFEGLFVKNLENVQGDERDDIIISTTYGPDGNGKFFRRFGPVGMSGGGRRLNVLVTRARREVHLVTSIPAQAYRSLPEVPAGQSATGAWLLFAYLKYAEELSSAYAQRADFQRSSAASSANIEPPTSNIEHRGEEGANVQLSTLNVQRPSEEIKTNVERRNEDSGGAVNVRPSRSPSLFAAGLARALKSGADVHWGNDGFCVDLAMHHPSRPGDVTIGVLCDGCRYAGAEDAVEWDIFRSGVLAGQGWKLHRIWTPHFFRDPQGDLARIDKAQQAFVASEKLVDVIKTVASAKVESPEGKA